MSYGERLKFQLQCWTKRLVPGCDNCAWNFRECPIGCLWTSELRTYYASKLQKRTCLFDQHCILRGMRPVEASNDLVRKKWLSKKSCEKSQLAACRSRVGEGKLPAWYTTEEDILKMGILVWVPLPTSQMPCGKWDVSINNPHFPSPHKWDVGKFQDLTF